jgi:hypothetical protein
MRGEGGARSDDMHAHTTHSNNNDINKKKKKRKRKEKEYTSSLTYLESETFGANGDTQT